MNNVTIVIDFDMNICTSVCKFIHQIFRQQSPAYPLQLFSEMWQWIFARKCLPYILIVAIFCLVDEKIYLIRKTGNVFFYYSCMRLRNHKMDLLSILVCLWLFYSNFVSIFSFLYNVNIASSEILIIKSCRAITVAVLSANKISLSLNKKFSISSFLWEHVFLWPFSSNQLIISWQSFNFKLW